MNDALLSLIQIAGITLLITVLWAITLGVTYWDIHRRQQAGQRINGLAWMAVVALIPFLGLVVYLAARLIAGSTAVPKGPGSQQPVRRRETQLKAQPSARRAAVLKGLPTIHGYDSNQETHLSRSGAAQPPAVQYQFSVTRGPDQGKTFLVDHFPVQIGRGLDSQIRLELDTGISRKHALVYQLDGALWLRDLGSRHGTRVNGRPVVEQPLKPGDRIEAGMTSLSCRVVEPQHDR